MVNIFYVEGLSEKGFTDEERISYECTDSKVESEYLAWVQNIRIELSTTRSNHG